jgi:hypothetical protein
MKLTASYTVVRIAEPNPLDLAKGMKIEGELVHDPKDAEQQARENLKRDKHHYEALDRMEN